MNHASLNALAALTTIQIPATNAQHTTVPHTFYSTPPQYVPNNAHMVSTKTLLSINVDYVI